VNLAPRGEDPLFVGPLNVKVCLHQMSHTVFFVYIRHYKHTYASAPLELKIVGSNPPSDGDNLYIVTLLFVALYALLCVVNLRRINDKNAFRKKCCATLKSLSCWAYFSCKVVALDGVLGPRLVHHPEVE
jgi:hypothetical protein